MGLLAELFSDDKGLAWPAAVAPFQVYLISLGDNPKVLEAAEAVYNRLTENSVGVLYDDRQASAGEKLNDADLIGLPYRVVVSDKTITENGSVELKPRTQTDSQLLTPDNLLESLGKPSPS
jgi:prolyl-tRNA synthetase